MMSRMHDTSHAVELAPGVAVEEIVPIVSSAQLADVLATATDRRDSVVPFGGRRSLVTGNPVGPARWGVDMTGLSGIISHAPADLTLSVRSGTTIDEVQATLAGAGQELPLDVPYPETTTIGGLVATGFAGPRRLRSGSLRDLLIGCEFVRGDGLLAKAGGLVVKNVSGFEIPRFLHGSWGALAVLTSVNLKVMPMARSDGTLLATYDEFGTAVDAAHRLIASDPSIEACVVTSDASTIRVAARAMGRASTVTATLQAWAALLGAGAERLEEAGSRQFWQDRANEYAEDPARVVLAVATRPRHVRELAVRLCEVRGSGSATMQVSPGLGSLRIAMPADRPEAAVTAVAIAAAVTASAASYVLESAPVALRETLPAWGAEPDGMALMRSIKREFDPAGVLNRGRLPI